MKTVLHSHDRIFWQDYYSNIIGTNKNIVLNLRKIPEVVFFYRIKNNGQSMMMTSVKNKYKKLRVQIYEKNKSIYDLFYTEHYSLLIYENYSLNKQLNLYKKRLNKLYSNPVVKIYFFIQNIIYGKK